MKNLLLLISILLGSLDLHAGTFTSLVNGSWNVASTWTAVGDSDGIPDIDDDVTIQAIHNVSVTGTGHNCLNLVANGILTLTSSCNLSIWGNYTLNGSEAGSNGSLSFKSSNGTISGAGTFGSLIRYSFVGSNYTISSEVVILKSIVCSAGNGTITNNGYVRWQRIYGNNSTWINNSGSTLEFGYYIIDSWNVTLNTSAANNTVIYSASSGSHIMKDPVNNTYHHLIFSGSGSTKRMPDDIIVNGTFTLSTNASVDSEGFDLYLRGNFTKPQFSGNITQDPGTVINFDGSSAQTITSTGSLTLNDLVFNNPTSVSFLAGLFNISNSMSVLQGNLSLGSNLITLISTAAKTAYIGESAGTISGTMTIQRFVSARADGYSDMSSPISGSTFAQLDDDIEMLFVSVVANQSSPSAFGYNETIWDYFAIDQTSAPMNPGEGYEVYLDNDGSNTTSWNATTIDFLGTPNRGDITFPATVNNDGWNLVGNPYASFISFATFRTNSGISMQNYFQVYDETILDFTTLAGTENIAPGQGFWIEATSAGSATFRENNKIISTSSTYRSMNINENLFALRVSTPSVTNRSHTYFRFDDAAAEYYESGHDISFLKVPQPNAPSLYTLSSDQKKLRINEMKGKEEMAIPVYFKAGVDASYTFSSLNIESAEFEGYKKFILEDKKLGIFHDLKSGDYSFLGETNEDTDRFILHLYKNESQELLSTNNLSEISFTQSLEGTFVNFNLPETKNATISLFDILGKELTSTRSLTTSTSRENIILPSSFSGVYFIQVVIEDKIFTQRFFKTL